MNRKFVLAICPEASVCTVAYSGYSNYLNVDKIVFVYSYCDKYEAVVDFGSRLETWTISEKTFYDLIDGGK